MRNVMNKLNKNRKDIELVYIYNKLVMCAVSFSSFTFFHVFTFAVRIHYGFVYAHSRLKSDEENWSEQKKWIEGPNKEQTSDNVK